MDSRIRPLFKSHSPEWLFCVLLAFFLTGCAGEEAVPVQLSGASMGTTWHLTYVENDDTLDPADVHQAVQAQLDEIERALSTYRDDSEISQFNIASVGESVALSESFAAVLEAALDVGESTQGAYDVTVGPLVDLWGFGPGEPILEPPAKEAIQATLQTVGQSALRYDVRTKRLQKDKPVELDFSSLAKGYAVDRVAQALSGLNLTRYLVEVGGEMRVAGLSPRGDRWRIAIEQADSASRSVAAAAVITDAALATSGDYRNFFESDGVRYSHSIDARTGYPVTHDLVSVTVLHSSAMWADAWATALLLLGAEQAPALAQSRGLAVYFIRREGEGFTYSYTAAFSPFLEGGAPGMLLDAAEQEQQ